MTQQVQASQLKQDQKFIHPNGNIYRVVSCDRKSVRVFVCCRHTQDAASEIRLRPHEQVEVLDPDEVSIHQGHITWITHLELPSTT